MQSRITSYKHIYLEFSIKCLCCHRRGQSGFIILSPLFALSDRSKNALVNVLSTYRQSPIATVLEKDSQASRKKTNRGDYPKVIRVSCSLVYWRWRYKGGYEFYIWSQHELPSKMPVYKTLYSPLCLMPGINAKSAWKATWYRRWHESSQTLPKLGENSAIPSPQALGCQGAANLLC